MNREKRKILREATAHLDRAYSLIEDVKDREADDRDNLPENMQDGDRFQMMDDAVDAMEDAMCCVRDAKEYVTRAL